MQVTHPDGMTVLYSKGLADYHDLHGKFPYDAIFPLRDMFVGDWIQVTGFSVRTRKSVTQMISRFRKSNSMDFSNEKSIIDGQVVLDIERIS